MKLVVIAALGLAAAGCHPYLVAQSLPPPGRVGVLDPVDGFWGVKSYKLEISTGTALAITCVHGGPCERMLPLSADPAVAEVIPAALARLEASGWASNRPSATFLVVGKRAGTTTILVKARGGDRRIAVTVVPTPAPAAVVAAPVAAAP